MGLFNQLLYGSPAVSRNDSDVKISSSSEELQPSYTDGERPAPRATGRNVSEAETAPVKTQERVLEAGASDQKRMDGAAARVRDLEDQLRDANAQNASIHYNHQRKASTWEAEIVSQRQENDRLRRRAEEAEAQYATLLKHLQPSEPFEPGDILRKFNSLNASIKDISFTLGRACLRAAPNAHQFTSTSGRTDILLSMLPGAGLLVCSTEATARPIDDFIELAYRHIVNEALCTNLFCMLHPSLPIEANVFSQKLYQMIRSREPQLLAAKWRSSFFHAKEQNFSSEDFISWVSNMIVRKVRKVPAMLFRPNGVNRSDSWFTAAMRQSIVDIVTSAYHLNVIFKTSCLSLDFQPILFDETYSFSSESMVLHGDHEPFFAPGGPNHIICAVNLGLQSSESFGSEKSVKYTMQVKAEVLTEGYFRDD